MNCKMKMFSENLRRFFFAKIRLKISEQLMCYESIENFNAQILEDETFLYVLKNVD